MPLALRKLLLGLALIAAASAALVASDLARARRPADADAPDAPPRVRQVTWLTYSNTVVVEANMRGVRDELARLGWRDGDTMHLTVRDAQLDIATLNAMVAAAVDQQPDVVVTFTTPALQAALRKIDRMPLVFSLVTDPIAAGAGTTNAAHRANVTGVSAGPDARTMAALIKEAFPKARTVGSVYCPAELNSVINSERFGKELQAVGLEYVPAPADRATDVSQAADTLAGRQVDVIAQISDSLSGTAFPAIARVAERTRIPLLSFVSDQLRMGSVLAAARDYETLGHQAARMVDRVLRGADPATMPFEDPEATVIGVNLERARTLGITLPPALVARAGIVIGVAPAGNAAPADAAPAKGAPR